MSLFLSLQPLAGVRQLALEQWNAALRKAGHQVEESALRYPDVPGAATSAALGKWIVRRKPAAIFTASPLSFMSAAFFSRPEVAAIPTAAFWFDDPYRPINRYAEEPGFLDAMRLSSVHHFVWDGYWRKWLKEKHAIASHPIHLAADPDDFHPLPSPREHDGAAIFIGTLVSGGHLQALYKALPPVLAGVGREVEAAMAAGAYGTNPFALLEEVVAALPAETRNEMAALRAKNPDAFLQLEGLVWKLGKNEVRRRMLRAALEVAPVAVFSGNLEKSHAGIAELETVFAGTPHKLRIYDTASLGAGGEALSQLYAHGTVHLQATDPQSVEGGIPFRVFQTTACEKALLTDVKAELLECYAEEKEIACYRTEAEIGPKLERLLSSVEERNTLAKAGRERFLSQHTWNHRIAEVFKTLALS